jgi:hypothetical protein
MQTQPGSCRPLRMRAMWYPKDVSAPEEWEDGVLLDESNRVAIVLDGASSSFDARGWVRHLAGEFWDSPLEQWDDTHLESWLWSARFRWEHHAMERRAARQLPEYLDPPSLERQSGATLVAVHVEPAGGYWEGFAVGDACVFHVRGDDLLSADPIADPGDFAGAPSLVTTGSDESRPLRVEPIRRRELCPGDHLMLASDAVSCWLLGEERDWGGLAALDQDGFAQLVESERTSRRMQVDDATLVCCTWAP